MDYEKKKEFMINIFYWAIIIAMVYAFFKYVFGYISPFVAAFIIAGFLKKPTKFLIERFNFPNKVSAIIMVVVFYGAIAALMSLIGINLFGWIAQKIMALPHTYVTGIEPFLNSAFRSIEKSFYAIDPNMVDNLSVIFTQLTQSISEIVSGLSMKVVSAVSNRATSLPRAVVKIALAIIATFFMAADYDNIGAFMGRQVPRRWKHIFYGIRDFIFKKLLYFAKSYFFIMMITFVELSIGLTVLGIENSIAIAFGIAVFDIIPVLGTGGIMIPWAIIRVLQGDFSIAVALMIVYLAITVIRNIIEPKIVSSQLGLHPVLTLSSMFIGISLLGIFGLFAAPIIVSLIKYLKDENIISLYK